MADRANYAQDLLRTFVLKTNPHFPFRYCNRWPYHLALKAVVGAARKNPGVRSVYLRHGFASGEWIPGLSDIDVTIVLGTDLPAGREFDLVDWLRVRCQRLKRFFPMLGEVEIFTENDLETWLDCGSRAPARPGWMLLHGQPTYDSTSGRSLNWRVKALDFALWVYVDLLPACVSKPDSRLRGEDVRRRVRKILRVLAPVLSQPGEPEPRIELPAEVPALVAHAAKSLETAVTRVDCGSTSGVPDASWFPSHANRCHFRSNPPACLRGVRSAIAFHDKLVVILANGLTHAEIAAATVAAASQWALPLVALPENVFRYMVCRYNPYDYSTLYRGREIAFGTDPLEGMPPPGRAEFAAHLLGRLDHILAFTRGEELFPVSGSLPVRALDGELRRLMGLRLLLKKGWITPNRGEIDKQWRREFPDCAQALDGIKQAAGARAARQAAFVLFRSLAAEVREAAAAWQP